MTQVDESSVLSDASAHPSLRRSAEPPPWRKNRKAQSAEPLSLRHNFAWVFPANIVYAACHWGILVALAKLGTVTLVGQFVLGLSVTSPIFVCASLQLRSIQATDPEREFRFGEYLGLRIVASAAALLLVLLVTWSAGHTGQLLAALLLMGLAKAIESISDIVYGSLQLHGRMDRVARSRVAHGVLSLGSIAIGTSLTGTILGALSGLVVCRLVVLLAYDLPSAIWVLNGKPDGRVRPSWNIRRLSRLTWLGLPLAGTTLLVSLETYIPYYFVAHYWGVSQVGIFGAIAALITAGGTVTRAINQITIPRLASHYRSGQLADFRQLLGRILCGYLVLGVLGVAAVPLVGRPLLSFLFRPEYAAHTQLFLFVMIAAAAAYLSGAITTSMIAVRLIGRQLPLRCLTVLTSFGICWWLVPQHGLVGASMALIFAKIPFVVIGLIMLWRRMRESERPEPDGAKTHRDDGGRLCPD